MRCARIVVICALVATGLEAAAHACSVRGAGIYSRSVWPGPDAHPPLNARIVVSYDLASYDWVPSPPAIGSDLVLLDSNGSTVPTMAEVSGNDVVLRPTAPLLADTAYRLADRRKVPCDVRQGECELVDAPEVFASFTTGAGPDDMAPHFLGVSSSSLGEHLSCASDACCGTYDVYQVNFLWQQASDDVAGPDVRYNVYRRAGTELAPVALRVSGTTLSGFVQCSGNWGGPTLTAGSYVVRAVDWAGNEDANNGEVRLGDACSSATGEPRAHDPAGCAVADPGFSPSSRGGALIVSGLSSLLGFLGLAAVRSRRRPP